MENFVLYTKSYSLDVEVCKRLKDSVIKHNVENIPFYVSVPTSDIDLFRNKLGTDGYTLILSNSAIATIALAIFSRPTSVLS